MKKIIIFVAFFIILPWLKIHNVQAATLYFSPDQGSYNIGDTFTVDVRLDLDSEEKCINTIEGIVGFDNSYLNVVDFSAGESFLSLWLNQPRSSDMDDINYQKRLKFTGGVPGGYCGKIPGDAGDSNIAGKIVFKVINSGADNQPVSRTKIFFYPDSTALLNDGFGTKVDLKLKEADFGVSKIKSGNLQEWDKIKMADNVPPEPFTIMLLKDSDIYEGKYYLAWNTTDKQSGIDYYEVQETRSQQNDWWPTLKSWFGKKDDGKAWKRAEQPYVIQDQSLKSSIRVKAVDKAGNSQIAEYFPDKYKRQESNPVRKISSAVVLLIIAMAIAIRIFRIRRSANQ